MTNAPAPSERFLARLSHFTMVGVIFYVVGLASHPIVYGWVKSERAHHETTAPIVCPDKEPNKHISPAQ